VNVPAIDYLQQAAQRSRIELRAFEIGDVDAEGLQRLFREVAFAEADERDAETRRIESRDHPAEQTLDPVHPGALPAEVIADLEHVQGPIAHVMEKKAGRAGL